MSDIRKCQAKGGPAFCKNPKCPEKMDSMNFEIPKAFEVHSQRTLPKLPVFGAWTEKDTELLKTIHGSKLYGLAHAGSDDDFYVVTPTVKVARNARKNNARQSISGNLDTVYVDFKTFTRLASEGVPQALEAMYSRQSESEYFEDYRRGYFSSDPVVIHTYMRTMKSFSLTEKDTYKRKRHALRLALNLEEILYTGRFNPTLNAENANRISRYASYDTPEYFRELRSVSPIEVDWEPEK